MTDGQTTRRRHRKRRLRARGCERMVPAPVPGPTIARPVEELELEDGEA